MAMPVLAAGHEPTAAEFKQITDQIDSLTSASWTDYSGTFALYATTTNPTKGNSTYQARYRRPAGSNFIHARMRIDIGSTFSAGSGTYCFRLPVTASANAISMDIGIFRIFDSGTAHRNGGVIIGEFNPAGVAAADVCNIVLNGGTAPLTSSGSGTAWASGDIIVLNIMYEAA